MIRLAALTLRRPFSLMRPQCGDVALPGHVEPVEYILLYVPVQPRLGHLVPPRNPVVQGGGVDDAPSVTLLRTTHSVPNRSQARRNTVSGVRLVRLLCAHPGHTVRQALLFHAALRPACSPVQAPYWITLILGLMGG